MTDNGLAALLRVSILVITSQSVNSEKFDSVNRPRSHAQADIIQAHARKELDGAVDLTAPSGMEWRLAPAYQFPSPAIHSAPHQLQSDGAEQLLNAVRPRDELTYDATSPPHPATGTA